jgi:hypothetical protein
MAKEKFLFELDELVEAVEELNALLFDDEHAISTDQKEGALQQAIIDASVILDPKDKVSKDTLKMIKALKDSGIEPTPEEEEEKKKPAEEELKAKEKEEKKDAGASDEQTLFEKVDGAKTRRDLVAIIKANDTFADDKDDLLDIDEFLPLQEKMLDMIEQAEKPKGKKVAEKAPVEKKERVEKKDAPKAEKKAPIKKAGEEGKPGIIATIVNMIEKAGKKGVTKDEILAQLKEDFPDRAEHSMKNTINVQIPARISKEKFKLEKLEGGFYRKAKE